MPITYKIELNRNLFLNCGDVHPFSHSKSVDRFLGYRISKIEEKLIQKYCPYDVAADDSNKKQHYKGSQTWIGLNP